MLAAASRLAVQGARDLTAPVVVVVPVVLRSMIVLGLALRDFMVASVCFACWAAEGSATDLSVIVACVGGPRGSTALFRDAKQPSPSALRPPHCSVERAYGGRRGTVLSGTCTAAEMSAAGFLAVVSCVGGARGLATSMAVLGGAVLRTMRASVLTARGDVASSVGCPTACGAAEAAVFANVFAFGEALDDLGAGPLMLVEVAVVRLMLSSVRAARGDVASSVGCPTACGAAEAAVIANVVAFDELLDDLGAERLFLKLSLAGSFWCHGRL